MAKMATPKEIGAKTPVKSFSKLGAEPTVKTAATAVAPKAAETKTAYNRLANLGAFAHPSKRKKKG